MLSAYMVILWTVPSVVEVGALRPGVAVALLVSAAAAAGGSTAAAAPARSVRREGPPPEGTVEVVVSVIVLLSTGSTWNSTRPLRGWPALAPVSVRARRWARVGEALEVRRVVAAIWR